MKVEYDDGSWALIPSEVGADKEYYLWFKEDDFLTTFKIFNDFGPRTATWRLVESMPSAE